MTTLADMTRELRQERGWSLRDLSERSGVAFGNLSDIEREAIRNPRVETVQRIASAFGVGVDALLFTGGEAPWVAGL